MQTRRSNHNASKEWKENTYAEYKCFYHVLEHIVHSGRLNSFGGVLYELMANGKMTESKEKSTHWGTDGTAQNNHRPNHLTQNISYLYLLLVPVLLMLIFVIQICFPSCRVAPCIILIIQTLSRKQIKLTVFSVGTYAHLLNIRVRYEIHERASRHTQSIQAIYTQF